MPTISDRDNAEILDDNDHFLVRQPSATGEKTRRISFGDLKDQIPGSGGGVQCGKATLASGTVTVSAAWVTTNSRIVATPLTAPGVPGSTIYIDNAVASTSFDITSEDITDSRDVFWLAAEEAAPVLVMKSNHAAGDAYVTKDWGSDESEVWVTFGAAFDSAALTFFNSDYSGDLAEILDGSNVTNTYFYEFPDPPNYWWVGGFNTGGDETGTAVPDADAWHTYELHFTVNGDVELYIDTALVAGATDTGSSDARKLRLGLRLTTNDADAVCYYKAVKIGTTRGASDLFADDFSSNDLSNWGSTTGDCTVITDPF